MPNMNSRAGDRSRLTVKQLPERKVPAIWLLLSVLLQVRQQFLRN